MRAAGRRERARLPIAEGIAVKSPGELTSSIIRVRLDDIVTVSDEEISAAIVLLVERTKLLVEGAGAAGAAALLAGRVGGGEGPVTVILSGGNIDATLLITVLRHGLTVAGRYLVVRTRISDRPGALAKLLGLIAEERVSVVSVEHHREGMSLSIADTEVALTLVTRDEDHCTALLEAMRRGGDGPERLREEPQRRNSIVRPPHTRSQVLTPPSTTGCASTCRNEDVCPNRGRGPLSQIVT